MFMTYCIEKVLAINYQQQSINFWKVHFNIFHFSQTLSLYKGFCSIQYWHHGLSHLQNNGYFSGDLDFIKRKKHFMHSTGFWWLCITPKPSNSQILFFIKKVAYTRAIWQFWDQLCIIIYALIKYVHKI